MKLFYLVLFFCQIVYNFSDSNVYICGTKGAKKYHFSENCRGLNACKHEIIKTSQSEAKGFGLTLCGWED
jgi:hypothetical protein